MSQEAVVVEATLVPVRDNSTLIALERAQVDQQIATAKAYPRSLQRFKSDVLSMATFDQETAGSMTYLLPSRGENGKPIEGPSVRLAEIAGSCWGNCRYGARVIEVGDEYLTARGMCVDLERNVAIEIDVRRSIVGKKGRFGANLIQVVGQAACAIALRNAIFKVIPMAFIKPAMEAAKKVAAGDEKTLVSRRDSAFAWFKEKGVSVERLLGFLGVQGKDDVNLDHLQQMSAIRTALKDGEASLEDFFGGEITKTVTPESLDAFVNPVSVKSGDEGAPIVEATLAEAPKPEQKKAAKGKADAHVSTENMSKAEKGKLKSAEDQELDELFSK